MRKHLFAALALSALLVPAISKAEAPERYITQYGDASFTAASSASIFFRPNGSQAIPATYTATSLVPQSVYIETMSVIGQNDTVAMQVTLLSTDTTYTAGTNEKLIQTVIVPASGSANTPRFYDFTNYGTSKGLPCEKWPVIRVDSGANTPIVKIKWSPRPKNKTQGSNG